MAQVDGSGIGGGGYHVFEVRHDLERRRSVLGVRPFVSVVRSIAIYNEVNVGNFNAVEGERTKVVERRLADAEWSSRGYRPWEESAVADETHEGCICR